MRKFQQVQEKDKELEGRQDEDNRRQSLLSNTWITGVPKIKSWENEGNYQRNNSRKFSQNWVTIVVRLKWLTEFPVQYVKHTHTKVHYQKYGSTRVEEEILQTSNRKQLTSKRGEGMEHQNKLLNDTEVREKWNNTFKFLKENNFQSWILCSNRPWFQYENRIICKHTKFKNIYLHILFSHKITRRGVSPKQRS